MGTYDAMFRHHRRTLDTFAEAVNARERYPIFFIAPPRPGVGEVRYPVEGFFDPTPAQQIMKAIGISNAYNGVLYVRESHCPVELTRIIDHTIPVGYRVVANGRSYNVTKGVLKHGEYMFVLADEQEVGVT